MRQISILRIALKILLHSKKKLIGMLIGSTLAAFIVMQEPGTYQGVSDRLIAQIKSINEVDLWVMSRESWDFSDPTYFNALDIYRIRAIPGVLWAKTIYRTWYGLYYPKLGKIVDWELIGIEPDSLIGLPKKMLAGDRNAIYRSDAVIVDGYALKQLEGPRHERLQIGDKLIDGGRKFEVVAISEPLRSYSSHPKMYMLNNHIPGVSGKPYFILVKINPTYNVKQVAYTIQATTGNDALTPKQFIARALKYFREKTPIIIIFISVAVLGFSIGLVIMWQIFSNFIMTHLHQFGMLKMLGVNNNTLIYIVLFQAAVVGGLGYLLGLFLTLLFGFACYDTTIAFHLTWQIAALGALGTVLIIFFSSYFSILKVLRLDSVELCRDIN